MIQNQLVIAKVISLQTFTTLQWLITT